MAFCTECGANVPDDVKFCVECGKPMDAARTEPDTVPAQAAATVNQAPPVQARPAAQTAPPPQYQQQPYSPPQQAAYAGAAPPPKGGKYSVMSTGAYIGTMILFAIPIIGWLACIIMAFAAGNRNRRNFARAMLVFMVIGLILAIAAYFLFSWIWEAARDYGMQYISDATGGSVSDTSGLSDLFDLFKDFDVGQ
jgi:hypothetical protein